MWKRLWHIGVLVAVTTSVSGDWPQYLGPNRDATAQEKGLAREWPNAGLNVRWTYSLGPGFGGAAVSSGKVYVADRVAEQSDVLRCLDLVSGKQDWEYSYDATGRVGHSGGRCVPAVDGPLVYTSGQFGDLHCIDTRTRGRVWHRNIWGDFGGGDRSA